MWTVESANGSAICIFKVEQEVVGLRLGKNHQSYDFTFCLHEETVVAITRNA